MLSVGVNGYGTIGKRVADAVRVQPDMRVAGVTKTKPGAEAAIAEERGYPLYTIEQDRLDLFREAGFEPAGLIEELVQESDVIVDATPGGVGETYLPMYREYDTPAIFQGKEDHEMVDASFNARANFGECVGADYLRVVSCNTTGLTRTLAPLVDNYEIEAARATLVRRGGDPDQSERGPINDTIPDPVDIPSHHGPDIGTVLPEIDVTTVALRVPTTLMHVHAVSLTLAASPDPAEVASVLDDESRVFLVPEYLDVEGIAALAEYGRDRGRPRGDMWESCLWDGSLTVDGRELYFIQAVHQESNVVPENIDAIRAITGSMDAADSMQLTDEQLGIGNWPGQLRDAPTPTPPSE